MSVSVSTPPGAARPAPDRALHDPGLASQHIFRQVLDALANPGTLRPGIVHPGVAQDRFAGNRYLASVLLALLDHEVSVHIDAGVDAGADLETLLVRRTRVALAGVDEAAFAVADAASMSPQMVGELRRGSLSYPDDGATLVLDVDSLDRHLPDGVQLQLTGPGIETSRTLHLPTGVNPAVVDARNRAVGHYPTGIDLLLIDRAGYLAGLPRTTVLRFEPEGGR